MSQILELGKEVNREGKTFLVVRLVSSDSIFEKDSNWLVVKEIYAELRGPSDEVLFESIISREAIIPRGSTQKALNIQIWRNYGRG